jgi:hypothetical protein
MPAASDSRRNAIDMRVPSMRALPPRCSGSANPLHGAVPSSLRPTLSYCHRLAWRRLLLSSRIVVVTQSPPAPGDDIPRGDHRGGAPGREDGSTRRREMLPLVPPVVTRPAISSPPTVSSPSQPALGSLKRNTSPATVPSMVSGAAPRGKTRNVPLTVDPCCFSSNTTSRAPAAPPTAAPMLPDQVPVTSTVTSVRSIQSFCAQPALIVSIVAKSSPARVFTPSPRW